MAKSARSVLRAAKRIGPSAKAQRPKVSDIGAISPTANRPTIAFPAQISAVSVSSRIGLSQAARHERVQRESLGSVKGRRLAPFPVERDEAAFVFS